MTINLAHLGVNKKFWLVPINMNQATEPPYQKAIQVLRNISQYVSPHEKLNCLSKAGNAIFESINDFCHATAVTEPVTV